MPASDGLAYQVDEASMTAYASTPSGTIEPYVSVSLKSVYDGDDHGRHWVLWALLKEREPHQNISHKAMPSWEEHIRFIESRPYEAWYFIFVPGAAAPVGACYLSKQNEIGIFLFHRHQRWGFGAAAVRALMDKHGPRRYLANINPQNQGSRWFFDRLGFKLVQHTYECLPGR